jgi:hypothetical protein
MDEHAFHEAIVSLETLAQETKAPETWRTLSDQAAEDFFRAWPQIRGWGEWLFQLIDNERGEKAAPVRDPELDETGEGAGG